MARRDTIANRTMYVYAGRVFCSQECAVNTLEYPPTDPAIWRGATRRVVVPGPLLPFVKCSGCGCTADEQARERDVEARPC